MPFKPRAITAQVKKKNAEGPNYTVWKTNYNLLWLWQSTRHFGGNFLEAM